MPTAPFGASPYPVSFGHTMGQFYFGDCGMRLTECHNWHFMAWIEMKQNHC